MTPIADYLNLGDRSMNVLKMGARLAWAKLRNGAIPFQVTINLLDACNLRCEYCYCAYPERHQHPIPHSRLLALIDELAAAGTMKINLAGGEPLLYNKLASVIQRIRDHGVDCYVNTNGFLVRKHLAHLKQITRLNISLDGDQPAHDLARGAGSHAQAIDALDIASREGIPRLITAVVGTHNLDQLDYLCDMMQRYDTWVNIVNLMQPRDLPRSRFTLNDQQARQLFAEVLQRKMRGQRFSYSRDAIKILLDWPLPLEQDLVPVDQPFPGKAIHCYAGRFFCAVDTNGDLFPCCPSIGVVRPAPNIMEQSFAAAFAKLRDHSCRVCNVPQSVDMNLLFGLRASVIWNTLKAYGVAPAHPNGAPETRTDAESSTPGTPDSVLSLPVLEPDAG